MQGDPTTKGSRVVSLRAWTGWVLGEQGAGLLRMS
jgi:hypothetical protein